MHAPYIVKSLKFCLQPCALCLHLRFLVISLFKTFHKGFRKRLPLEEVAYKKKEVRFRVFISQPSYPIESETGRLKYSTIIIGLFSSESLAVWLSRRVALSFLACNRIYW